MEIKNLKDIEGVYYYYQDGIKKLATVNLSPGKSVYDEDLIKQGDIEYRNWVLGRSKLAAAIYNGLAESPIKEGSIILYLGVSSGTTASHVSDIIGENGRIYGLDFAPRSLRDFISLCKTRKNLVPILADARIPESYRMLVENASGIYMDVAQPQQAQILVDNTKMFLEKGSWIMLCVKSQSIDVTKAPEVVYEEQKEILVDNDIQIKQVVKLKPFSLDHILIYGIYQP
jgi:fibrillarin-like pre-rRNA processing protein